MSLISFCSCIPNARFHLTLDRRIVVRALEKIPKGDEIVTRYLPALMSTPRRQHKIRNGIDLNFILLIR